MIILGIDPGFDRMGCAILEKTRGAKKLIASDCFVSDRKLPYEKRLFFMGDKVKNMIKKHDPDILAIEKLFFAKNHKTALQISEVRGMIMYIACEKNLAVKEFTPLEIKSSITGYGRAEKYQVQKILEQELKLTKNKTGYDDESDAIAIALTCAIRNNY